MPLPVSETLPRPPSAARIIYVVRGRPALDDRPCLPSGHPESWGRITAGTILEASPYPFPVFLR